jgi:hypothetical protein
MYEFGLKPMTNVAHISYYKVSNLCVSVCLCVCLSVCLSCYTFPQFSTDLPQMFREPSTGHDTFRGLNFFFARECVLNARVCVHSLIFERIKSKFAGNILRLTICGKD